MALAEAQQAACSQWTQSMESSIQIISDWQILSNWKDKPLMENVRESYAWLPSPSKLLTLPAQSMCVHACMYL